MCGAFVTTFVVRGRVVDAQMGLGLGNVPIDARPLKDGEFIGFISGTVTTGENLKTPAAPVTDPDGSFALAITNGARLGPPECSVLGTEVVTPDQVRIMVGLSGCQYQVFIDLNEQTVVDPSFAEGVIEFKEPILVPPCEE